MTRLTAAISITLAVLLVATSLPAQAMLVKSSATVEGPYVRLGDVLLDAGEADKDILVAAAPEPGEREHLSFHDIAAAARRAGLEGLDLGRGYIEVRRAGRAVSEELLKDRLRAAFAARGVEGPLGLRLTGLRGSLYVPLDADPDAVEIEALRHDERGDRFTVTLQLPAGDDRVRREEVAGVVEKRRHVPVLARTMDPGETIGGDDIAWIALDERRINRTMLVSETALVGKEPVRPLRADTPLRRSDVRRPLLVEKGALVTMVVANGPMKLSAVGKAMQDGARGDVIRLVNTDSNRTVEARITGPDRVRIVTAGGLAQAGQ